MATTADSFQAHTEDHAHDADHKPGFFARWFGGDNEDKQVEDDGSQLQVRLTPTSNRIEVSVDAGIEHAADGTTARELLERIQRGLNERPPRQ